MCRAEPRVEGSQRVVAKCLERPHEVAADIMVDVERRHERFRLR